MTTAKNPARVGSAYPLVQAGFTLMELLVVIALLGILAGVATMAYEGVPEQGRGDVTRFEMAEIRAALLQFRRDTGEFPCRVYRDGVYAPDAAGISRLNFAGLPATPSFADYQTWCRNGFAGQQDDALSLLLKFPYDDTDTGFMGWLWNPDTKRGWNGPYLKDAGLADGWGQRFVLLYPELDFRPAYRCKAGAGGDLDVTTGEYECLTADDPGWDDATFTEAADTARLVSFGPNGVFDGQNAATPCAASGDDLVLCLLR